MGDIILGTIILIAFVLVANYYLSRLFPDITTFKEAAEDDTYTTSQS